PQQQVRSGHRLSSICISGVHRFALVALGADRLSQAENRLGAAIAYLDRNQYLDVAESPALGYSSHVGRGTDHAHAQHLSAIGSVFRAAAGIVCWILP